MLLARIVYAGSGGANGGDGGIGGERAWDGRQGREGGCMVAQDRNNGGQLADADNKGAGKRKKAMKRTDSFKYICMALAVMSNLRKRGMDRGRCWQFRLAPFDERPAR